MNTSNITNYKPKDFAVEILQASFIFESSRAVLTTTMN